MEIAPAPLRAAVARVPARGRAAGANAAAPATVARRTLPRNILSDVLISTEDPRSFDLRCFGPVCLHFFFSYFDRTHEGSIMDWSKSNSH